jgi:predicted AAA+ superfamily ATPase
MKLWILKLIHLGTLPQNILYYSCEPLRGQNSLIQLITEYDIFSRNQPGQKYIFLDEITAFHDWENDLKFVIESGLSKNNVIITTGSNAQALKKGIDRLPGRNIHSRLFLPLSFREYVEYFGSSPLQQTLRSLNFQWKDLGNREKLFNAINLLIPFQNEQMMPRPVKLTERIGYTISADGTEFYKWWSYGWAQF